MEFRVPTNKRSELSFAYCLKADSEYGTYCIPLENTSVMKIYQPWAPARKAATSLCLEDVILSAEITHNHFISHPVKDGISLRILKQSDKELKIAVLW